MEKTLFNLQLFAETIASQEDSDPEKAKDDKEQVLQQSNNEAKEKKYTDADLDRIISKKFAEIAQRQERKTSEAERLGKLSAEEKANERIKALEDKLAQAERKQAKADMTKQARAILHAANINVSDELIGNLVSDSAEATQSSVKAFITLFNSAVDKAVKEACKGKTPEKGGTSSLTKKQILAVTNRAERQRLISENMQLFK